MPACSIRRPVLSLIALFFGIATLGSGNGPAHAQPSGVDLGALQGPSVLLPDPNGDGIADSVAGRLVLPDSARTAETTAATNLAARFGYETAAADLTPTLRARARSVSTSRPVVLIGRAARQGSTDTTAAPLAPGEGRIAVTPPSDRFSTGALRVTAGDASGLLAAADYASGRLPALWRPDGSTVEDVLSAVRDTLASLPVDTVRTRHVTVGRDRPGVLTLGLHIETPDARTAARVDSLLRPDDGTTTAPHPLHWPDVHTVAVRVAHPNEASFLRVQPASSWDTADAADPDRSVDRTPELHELYSLNGLYCDTNHDFVPDDVVGSLSYSGPADPQLADPLSALGMRIGLETAGARWPLVRSAGSTSPEDTGLPLLVGLDHPTVGPLREEGRLPGPAPEAREGALRVVEKGPGEAPALVMNGGDAAGLASVADYTARRLPYLGGHGKGTFRLHRIDTDVRRFVQGKDGAGQVAAGLEKLDTWLARLDTTAALDSLHITLAADSVPDGIEQYMRERAAAQIPRATVAVETAPTGFGVGQSILDEEWTIPWEGDTFWRLFQEDVLPRLAPGDTGRIELRLSEGPEVRNRLARDIRDALAERGLDTTAVDVSVLSAYKQGFSWLVDEVAPAVENHKVGRVDLAYHTLKESEEVRWQHIHDHTRWLQELYPVDAVLSRTLGLPDSLVTFTPSWDDTPIYSVDVLAPNGDTLHTDTFTPRYRVEPYFEYFPKHDSVRIPTGGLRVEMGGDTLVDRRIKTDLERFRDRFQAEIIPAVAAYAMDLQDGAPRPENAPFFDLFRTDIQLSEPDYRLGIQEHTISGTETVHEDLYFQMHALFTLLGNRYNVGALNYPGRILPFVRPPAPAEEGYARVTMTGKAHARPELRLAYTTEDGRRKVKEYPLPNIENVPPPALRGLRTRAGASGLSRLRFDVETEVDTSVYPAMQRRGPEAEIDRAYPSSERLQGMTRHLRRLQNRGLFTETLSYDRVEALQLRFVVDDDAATTRTATLPRTKAPQSTESPALPPAASVPGDGPLVPWDSPLSPEDADRLTATLGQFPEVHPYYMETSFLGHDIFAMDLRPPQGGAYVSQATLNAQRPTLYLNAREDGNEVSSTSYVLRLAEQAATTPSVRSYLDSVDVTILPVSNPDGAQVAYNRQQVNPDHMLHAGYYAALGPSMEEQEDESDPLYPEATVEPRLRKTTLPDVFMNLHGYPSHEWVQYFSGYSAWVFSRNGTARSWWPTRGYFLTGFDWVDDPDHPELETAAFAALDTITTALSTRDSLMALSRAEYERYRKYRQPSDDYGEYFRNGVRVHSALRGEALADAPPTDVRDPRITPFSITTEAQDETAHGDWLRLQAGAGLTAVTAALRYLYHGSSRVVRKTETTEGTVRRWVYREKPVLPPNAEANAEGE